MKPLEACELNPKIKEILNQFSSDVAVLNIEDNPYERPIYSTTLYLATCEVSMKMGLFKAHIFQDIIHKGYIIALAYGDIKTDKKIYTRIHSSCVTGETLRACDCDCAPQLNGALEKIAEAGAGILFYLMQEGRGVGYIAKSRDRMLVQASKDCISTFEAYHLLGLKRDYRQYRNIKPICSMLGIEPKFILLTNNPDKVSSLNELGINVVEVERLEYKPGPFNLAYLMSKREAGHELKEAKDADITRINLPEPVLPFKPYALKKAQRFIYASSYLLPVLAVDDEVVMSEKDFHRCLGKHSIDELIKNNPPLIQNYQTLRDRRFLVRINRANMKTYREENPDDPLCELLHLPYWFRVHVYFDIVTGEDYVVLTYGKATEYDTPIVRIQSESIFNRFPLTDIDNRDKFEATLQAIVRYGVGAIVLLYNDGRGAGFGAYAEDMMLMEQGKSKNTDESYQKLGVSYDRRDYDAAITLLKEHTPGNRVQMVMNSPKSLVKKIEYAEALNAHEIEVDKWIFLENTNI